MVGFPEAGWDVRDVRQRELRGTTKGLNRSGLKKPLTNHSRFLFAGLVLILYLFFGKLSRRRKPFLVSNGTSKVLLSKF